MPAVSQAQRAYLATHFGKAWMAKHHFDNTGPLPQHVGSAQGANERAVKRGKQHPKHHTRKPNSAAKAAAAGPIYQTAQQERIAKYALGKA